jgi:RsiW-degrading membrane proteinase PrsW (M82 family)
MRLRTLAENVVVVVGLFFFGLIGGFLLQMLLEPSFSVSEWTEQAVADARLRTIVFGVVGGYVMGVIAGIALKEEEE